MGLMDGKNCFFLSKPLKNTQGVAIVCVGSTHKQARLILSILFKDLYQAMKVKRNIDTILQKLQLYLIML